ncbi:MAG: rod shape-determining protein MreD [Proteobacteria bacterium]|nr:rod shape-determining protein MreD [Pseudomonadota bacterium]
MRWLRAFLPVASVAILTVVAILPWGLPVEDRFVLPLLPIVAIMYWTLDRDAWLPEWAVFLAGLMLDVLTQGPLGYWALIYLVAYIAAVFVSHLRFETALGRFGAFAGAIIGVTAFAWLAASVYFLKVLDWEPYIRSAAFALAAACLILGVRAIFGSRNESDRAVRLTRGA